MNFYLKTLEGSPDWRALHCPEFGLKIVFRVHEFNETQQVYFADEKAGKLSAQEIAHILREAGDWLYWHAYSEAVPVPVFEFRRDSSEGLHLIRNTPPRLDILIKDDATARELANALRAGAEFVRKIARPEENQG